LDEAMSDRALVRTSPQPPPEGAADRSVLTAVPGLVRIAAAAWWRTTGWAVGTSVHAASRVMRASVSGESPAELFQAARADLREYARRLLDIADPQGSTSAEPERDGRRRAADAAPGRVPRGTPGPDATLSSLRDRGAELLRQSADVHFEQETHPAYARMLEELAPDEGRILRLLALEGPQSSVDVRTGRVLNIASELVAPGLSMIGAEAGCSHPDRVHAYLNNLYRLGLIWFSREPVKDPLRYQVLEAQPDVIAAMRRAGRAHTVRRSIHLTPFGEDFCERCFAIGRV
jgi:Abortive infection alpha